LNAIGNIGYSDLSTVAIIDLRARLNFRRCVPSAGCANTADIFGSQRARLSINIRN
jgi:hypothetical protein